jgi:hypothetical protein
MMCGRDEEPDWYLTCQKIYVIVTHERDPTFHSKLLTVNWSLQ